MKLGADSICPYFYITKEETTLVFSIDTKHIEAKEGLQKDLKLEDLLLNHCKYVEDEEGYVPVDFANSIRSIYTNKVMTQHVKSLDEEEEYDRAYQYRGTTDVLPHRGYDLVMFMSSVLCMQSVKPEHWRTFEQVMMQSQFMPVGLLYTPFMQSMGMNPVIYTHTIIRDEDVDNFSTCLADGYKMVNLCDVNPHRHFKELLDSLMILKGEEDGSNNN